jgi:hypothetical protein
MVSADWVVLNSMWVAPTDYTFKLSINWPVTIVLSTSNWKSEKNLFLVIISHFLYYLHVYLLLYGFKIVPAKRSIFPTIAKPV